jgi:hypothetical protein
MIIPIEWSIELLSNNIFDDKSHLKKMKLLILYFK